MNISVYELYNIFDHGASFILWFISEVFELHCTGVSVKGDKQPSSIL